MINDIKTLIEYVKGHTYIFKVLSSNNPPNARKVYQIIQEKYSEILNAKLAQCSVIYITSIKKLIGNKDKKEDILFSFNKATTFELILKENCVNSFVDDLKANYFPKTQTSTSTFHLWCGQ